MGIEQSTLKDNLKKHKEKYLSGPVSLYYLKKDDVKIFLFGDEHFSLKFSCEKKNNSIDFIDFLNNIFLTTNKKIDFLIESSYNYIEKKDLKKNNIYYKEHSYLTKVINYYLEKGCFISNKKTCSKNFPLVHFHSIDYRYSNLCIPAKKINEIECMLIILSSHLQKSDNSTFIIDEFKKLMEKISFIDTYQKIEDEIKNIFECSKLQKQINMCDDLIKNKIIQYKNDILNINNKRFKNNYDFTMENLKNINNKKSSSFSYSILNTYIYVISSILVYIKSIIMDIYCLARIFRKFNGKSSMKNIIIYVGAMHSENYVNFLTKYMDFTLEMETIAVKKRCLNISNLSSLF